MLGDDRFMETLAIPIRKPAGATLESLAAEICAASGVTLEAFRGPSGERHLSRARGILAARVVELHIATLSDVARYLKRSVSTLSRLALRYAKDAKMQT